MSFKLPDGPVPAKKDCAQELILCHGISGMGKTTFLAGAVKSALAAKQTAILITPKKERGAEYHAIPRVVVADWYEFAEVVQELEKKPRDVVALDGIDALIEVCGDAVCKSQSPPWETPDDPGYGKGWAKVADEFCKWLDRLRALDCTIYASSQSRWENSQQTREITKYLPAIPGTKSVYLQILRRCGIIGFLHRPVTEEVKQGEGGEKPRAGLIASGERWLHLQPTEFYETKCRVPGLPDGIALGGPDEMFTRFIALFGKGVNGKKK